MHKNGQKLIKNAPEIWYFCQARFKLRLSVLEIHNEIRMFYLWRQYNFIFHILSVTLVGSVKNAPMFWETHVTITECYISKSIIGNDVNFTERQLAKMKNIKK